MSNGLQTPAPVGFCPRCGYDQRGLPAGSACPECGTISWPGHSATESNRWADKTLLGLWSVAVLLVVGLGCGIASGFAFQYGQSAGVMLAMSAAVYGFTAVLWFGAMAVAYLRRLRSPFLKNVSPRRRRQLSHWMVIDVILIAGPTVTIAALWHFLH